MKKVYQLTNHGWQVVFRAQSFEHACRVCREMQSSNPLNQFCVNS